MPESSAIATLFLLLTVRAGLFRIVEGPTFADRMIVAQLFGTTGVALLLLLSDAPGQESLRDVALVFALLASVTVLAFVRVPAPREHDPRAREAERK